MKMKNNKGYYKEGRLTFKDLRDGTQVLITHARIHDKEFIQYIKDLDRYSGGSLTAHHAMAAMAVMAFKGGLRMNLPVENKTGELV